MRSKNGSIDLRVPIAVRNLSIDEGPTSGVIIARGGSRLRVFLAKTFDKWLVRSSRLSILFSEVCPDIDGCIVSTES